MDVQPGRPDEIATKAARVRTLMDRLQLKGILLRRTSNVSWLTGGRQTYITLTTDSGVADILVTADRLLLLTTRIEAARMEDEEGLRAAGFELVVTAWHEPAPAPKDLAGGPVGADMPTPGCQDIGAQIKPLRYQLLPAEVARYRWLGQTTAEVLQTVTRGVTPGLTEHQIAGRLSGGLAAEGIVPTVLLVATDERIFRYRHPLPTAKRLDRYAMLVAGARRWGLHASCTRLIYFGRMPDDLRRKAEDTARIDATMITLTRPGARVADIFRRTQEAYAAAGYPDEWRLHHQGGACGYDGRDYFGVPQSPEVVAPNQAFAWNPSITGAKSEDTILAGDQGDDILTYSDNWPTWTFVVDNQACLRPVVLEAT